MRFSRRRDSGRGENGGRHARRDDVQRGGFDDDQVEGDEYATESATREFGPYDITEAPGGVQRLDLGSLKIPAIEGVEVRVQANPDGVVQQVVLVHGQSALQLGVFAAPRSEDIWDEVRAEIRKSLFDDGVAAEEIPGEYGVELRARVRTPEGLTDLRFVGVDGPRWMVRGVYQGPAAVDPSRAVALVECLRGLVVDRGNEAKPVREPLPLRLPRDVADQARSRGATLPPPEEAAPAPAPAAPPTNGAAVPPRRKPSPRPRRPHAS